MVAGHARDGTRSFHISTLERPQSTIQNLLAPFTELKPTVGATIMAEKGFQA